MKKSMKPTIAYLITAALLISGVTGCTTSSDSVSDQTSEEEVREYFSEGDDLTGGDTDLISFHPASTGIAAKETYTYPYMGLTATISADLLAKMQTYDVILLNKEDYNADTGLTYACMSWYALTEEQKNETVTSYDPDAWEASLSRIGTLGVYHTSMLSQLDSLTGCTSHTELGKSANGDYVYYLSLNDSADAALAEELQQTQVTLTEMLTLDPSLGTSAFSEARVDTSNVGTFQTTDVDGTSYTQELFQNYDLTLVNVFTTWCSPCVSEMPDLETLKQKLADKGVNVVGIVYDGVNDLGETDAGAVETALTLKKSAQLTFPLLLPDNTMLNGRLNGIDTYPESFFVDRNGNIVGDTYMGTHTLDEWVSIVETELANLNGGADE